MPTEITRGMLITNYYQAAQEYLRNLPLEHFMESTPQATQRKITLESLDLVTAKRPAVQVFNELLVQYPIGNGRQIGQVVPDNMVVLHPEPIVADGSYDLPLQPVPPFWVMEYVSKSSTRKDYNDSMEKYDKYLKVPYYLMFHPEIQDLTLFRHTGRKYKSVKVNSQNRYPIEELQLEVAILHDWVRFWLEGELLPLPGDLLNQRDEARNQRDEARNQRDEERLAREKAERELAQLRAEIERLKQGK